ncbi:MAG: elongation factor 4 [Candidatus Taylorbacteria bacterium]|nr:elongation factor 4 [Candidatus Taylorbacteria bacterium]
MNSMDLHRIRNFSIIAHIDHGKSTLADRLLEITGTIEKRKMQAQVLDSMELERERGITIKMQPVRMNSTIDGVDYVLNLIDTPGHIDFSYEVSRALKAVEGSILLVDATQGVQAQTLTTLNMARESGLTIIPVISKIDSPLARVEDVEAEICLLLQCDKKDVLRVSGKTGEGVENLLREVVKRVPCPKVEAGASEFRSLVFDFQYSNHRGVMVYVRVLSGTLKKNDALIFKISQEKFTALETGIFSPQELPVESLGAGEIGYIVTGIKEPGIASVGDTVASPKDILPALGGYLTPVPVVWASIYPEAQDDFNALRQALGRLRLSDSSFTHEEESSGALGRGFRCGFLGMLHLEIISERLRREFSLELIVTLPSITYEVEYLNGKKETIYSPIKFPEDHEIKKVYEPWVNMKIISPLQYVGTIMQKLYEHEAQSGDTVNFGDSRTSLSVIMPLRELMRNFFDEIKSVTSGYASISYEIGEMKEADVVRLDLLVADELVPAFCRVVSRRRVEEEAKEGVEKLAKILPRQMFTTKIQARGLGRIIASESLSAMKKDVTAHMYGGDITRKMKLREKQKKGKKRMLARGKVNIPHDVFLKMMRSDS